MARAPRRDLHSGKSRKLDWFFMFHMGKGRWVGLLRGCHLVFNHTRDFPILGVFEQRPFSFVLCDKLHHVLYT
jgi:hypothetical protein